MKLSKFKEYSLVFLLLFFSGNPLENFIFGKFVYLAYLIYVLITLGAIVTKMPRFFQLYFRVAVFLTFIFIFQWAVLGTVSWLGSFNYLLRIFVGGLVLHYFKDRFSEIFLKIIYPLSLISIILYAVINIANISLPYIRDGAFQEYVIYTIGYNVERNGGMFWEPGAFAGILTLCIALNFDNLEYYLKKHLVKLVIIVIALLTTQSTGGYLTLVIILIFYFMRFENKLILFVLVPLLFLGGFYAYTQTDFLGDKISEQLGNSQEQRVGEYSASRFGSIIFDLHYILKHPIIGNGLSEKTRYADDPDFANTKGGTGSGNAFSENMASLGVFFMLGYFLLLYKGFSSRGKLYAYLIVLTVLFNLQDEQWFNYPLYLGLPFIDFQLDDQGEANARLESGSIVKQ